MVNEDQLDETITFIDTSKFCEDMSPFFANETFSDVVFNVDGEQFIAHKVVLVTRCKFFETILQNNPKKSEFTINKVSSVMFKNILKYIYTGIFSCSKEIMYDALKVAHQYSLTTLKQIICEKLQLLILNKNNVCDFLNNANNYEVPELREVCHSFIKEHFSEFLGSNLFNTLTQKSIVTLLQTNTFSVPEIEIFKIVSNWCSVNADVDKLVAGCIQLAALSKEELLTVVWPSKLFDNDKLFKTFAAIVDKTQTEPEPPANARLIREINIATLQYNVRAITGTNAAGLFNNTDKVAQYVSHPIDGNSGVIVDLSVPSNFNTIKMKLEEEQQSTFRYSIQVSLNRTTWKKIIDYSKYDCRSFQHLYFEQQVARYIRVTGTYSATGKIFSFSNFEVYLNYNIPKRKNQIVCPLSNVFKTEMGALLIEGERKTYLRDNNVLYFHKIGSGANVFKLGQPYIISSILFKLFVTGDYKYIIETSIDKKDWQLAVDRKDVKCSEWQILTFDERPTVYIKIIGTSSSIGPLFRFSDFVCLNEEKRTGLQSLKSLISSTNPKCLQNN